MPNYRVVKIDKSGQLSRHRSFVCDNDDDAIVWAKRFVARLEPLSKQY
jgi:hypothetical protein